MIGEILKQFKKESTGISFLAQQNNTSLLRKKHGVAHEEEHEKELLFEL